MDPTVPVIVTAIPTLGEWGMIAMVAALGVLAFFALRKRAERAKQQ